jgi:hypothetical protein
VHHSAVDGVGAANVLGALLDLDPAGRTEQQVADLAALELCPCRSSPRC